VVVFNEEGQFQRRIGCESITNFPNGIDISGEGGQDTVYFPAKKSLATRSECEGMLFSRAG
jgi:hypothetical protein